MSGSDRAGHVHAFGVVAGAQGLVLDSCLVNVLCVCVVRARRPILSKAKSRCICLRLAPHRKGSACLLPTRAELLVLGGVRV